MTPPLDCLVDKYNNILTNPQAIAQEIHVQQSISNRPTVPTCYRQPDHAQQCIYGVRQYPWHDLNGYTIEKHGDALTPLHTYLDQETYDICLKNSANGKTFGPEKIPNAILKNMPPKFHKLLLLFFTNKIKFPNLGKQASQYSYIKNKTLTILPTIDQSHSLIQSINYSLAH